MYFVESKWIYNYLLPHQDGLFDIKTKYKELVNITMTKPVEINSELEVNGIFVNPEPVF